MRRWGLGQVVVVVAAGVAAGVVAKVVCDAVVKLRAARVEELKAALDAVAQSVGDIVRPDKPWPEEMDRLVRLLQTAGTGNGEAKEAARRLIQQPDVTRPEWAGGPLPVELGGDPDSDDLMPDDALLRSPYDELVTMAPGTLGPVAYVDPAPEAERMNGSARVATFTPGQNPLEDIGETPAWEGDASG